MVARVAAGVLLATTFVFPTGLAYAGEPEQGAGGQADVRKPGPRQGRQEDPQRIDRQDPKLLAKMRTQEKLHPVADAVLKTATKLPPNSGYAGVAFEGEGVTLYYKGSLPPAMAATVAKARKAGPVAVKAAPHSRAELERAQDKITAAVERWHSDIQTIGVSEDGSGLTVEKMPPATAVSMRKTLAAKKGITSKPADTLLKGLKLDVPIEVTTGTSPITFMSSREDDYGPWNGGVQYETWRGLDQRSQWCSTAFGVRKGGQTFVLTAAHCMTAPDRAYNGHFGGCCFEEMGPVHQENWDKDILLINARGSALMFDGGVNSDWTKTVHSWGYRVKDELLCTSGSRSGVICGDKTLPYEYNTYGCDSDGDCYTTHDMAGAKNIYGNCVGVKGDSGGPVFSLDGDGVRAKGVISGKKTDDCTTLYFQDMDEIVGGGLGATPMTW